MTTTLADHHWTQRGLCRLDDAFTPGTLRGGNTTAAERAKDIADAITICRRCPVLDLCDQWRLAQLAIDKTALSGQIVAGIYHE